jgi:hypothetical protein
MTQQIQEFLQTKGFDKIYKDETSAVFAKFTNLFFHVIDFNEDKIMYEVEKRHNEDEIVYSKDCSHFSQLQFKKNIVQMLLKYN